MSDAKFLTKSGALRFSASLCLISCTSGVDALKDVHTSARSNLHRSRLRSVYHERLVAQLSVLKPAGVAYPELVR